MLWRIDKRLASVVGWLARRPSYMLLTACDERLSGELPARFTYAWAELLVLSTCWGLASVGIWSVVWGLFGGPFGLVLPAATVAGAFVLWPFRRASAALVETLLPAESAARAFGAAVLVVLLTLALMSLQPYDYRRDAHLPDWIAWFRPWIKLYRVLLLMPLWGAWAMLITPQFTRPKADTEPAVAAFARGCGPLAAAAVMAALLAATITYFNFLPWEQVGISGAAVIAATAGGVLCCQATGGLNRRALLAANVLTQLAFLLAYLASRNLLTW